jgi:hypothetical protein
VFQNRVQMADNLIKKKWKGENKCKLCLKDESVDHLNFICHLSIFVSSVIKEGLKWEKIPRTVKEFIDECLLEGEGGDKNNGVLFSPIWAVCWAIWFNRNDFIFRNKLIPSLNEILYMLLFFM